MSGGEGNPFPYSSMRDPYGPMSMRDPYGPMRAPYGSMEWEMAWNSASPILAGAFLPFHRMLTLPPSLRRNLPSLVIRGLRRDLRYALNGSRLGDLQGDLRHVLGFKFKWYLETPGHFMEYPPPEGIPFTSSTSPRPA